MFRQMHVAVRSLARAPGYLLLTVSTLALGIGAATVLFTVTESVLWRPLPFPDSERLVFLSEHNIKRPLETRGISPRRFADLRDGARTFDRLAAFDWGDHHILAAPAGSRRVLAWGVSAGFFETLGVRPALGRTFERGDEHPGGNRIAILTDDCWRRDFGGSPDVLRRTTRMDGETYTIAGILPPGFELDIMQTPDLFVPLQAGATGSGDARWGAIARMGRQTSTNAAGTEMQAMAQQFATRWPQSDAGWTVTVENLRTAFTSFQDRPLFLFLGFSILVLAIACANVAGLLLVRFVAAQRDCALRLALGAGRAALLKEALAENLGIAIPGAVSGLLLAVWGTAAVRKWLPADELLRASQIHMDWTIVLFVAALMVATAVTFAVLRASLASGLSIESALQGGGRTASASRSIRRRIDLLMGAEVMLAFVLLFGAGLFASSYLRLTEVRLGFTPHGVMTMRVTPGARQLSDPRARIRFYDQLQQRVAGLPGVREVALGASLPLTGTAGVSFAPENHASAAGAEHGFTLARVVTPEYFHVLGIPLLDGRGFANTDSATSPRVAVVNERLARAAFGGSSPVGRQLTLLPDEDEGISGGPVQIVGVAANTTELGLNEVAFNDIYLPFAQNPARSAWIAGAVGERNRGVAAGVRRQLHAMDPEAALDQVMTMDERVRDSLEGSRFRMVLIAIFAGLAVLLACVGVFGAVAFSVSGRKREFGLRIALGARPAGIMKLAFAHTARLTAAGAVCGVIVALAAGWKLKDALYLVPHKHSGILFGVAMHDAAILGMAAAAVALLAAMSAALPAWSASKQDPVAALHHE